jgi:hypothetical protein
MQYKKSIIILFLPYFLILNAIFDYRRKKAIGKAIERSKRENRNIHVIQVNKQFVCGTREELRRYNKSGLKIIQRATKSRLFGFDYRNSLVYTAKQSSDV